MRRALDEFIIGGIRTNIPLQKRLLDLPDMRAGTMTTRTVEELMAADAAQRGKN
jgi:acetyl-CoA carboxylase, biotin carboxylase subunit